MRFQSVSARSWSGTGYEYPDPLKSLGIDSGSICPFSVSHFLFSGSFDPGMPEIRIIVPTGLAYVVPRSQVDHIPMAQDHFALPAFR